MSPRFSSRLSIIANPPATCEAVSSSTLRSPSSSVSSRPVSMLSLLISFSSSSSRFLRTVVIVKVGRRVAKPPTLSTCTTSRDCGLSGPGGPGGLPPERPTSGGLNPGESQLCAGSYRTPPSPITSGSKLPAQLSRHRRSGHFRHAVDRTTTHLRRRRSRAAGCTGRNRRLGGRGARHGCPSPQAGPCQARR